MYIATTHYYIFVLQVGYIQAWHNYMILYIHITSNIHLYIYVLLYMTLLQVSCVDMYFIVYQQCAQICYWRWYICYGENWSSLSWNPRYLQFITCFPF